MQFDEVELRKTIAILKPDNQLFEVRCIGNKIVYSGYFDDVDVLVKELGKNTFQGCNNVYITLNALNNAVASRSQRGIFEKTPTVSTSDKDVIGMDWLMVDLDPRRPTGVSSSDEELEKSKSLGNDIYKFMKSLGFEKPVVANSGNGVHLLYHIALKNTKENIELLSMSLKTLDMLFSNDDIEVDKTNFNPARICKLYGTMAKKGSNTKIRPHRTSNIIGNYDEVRTSEKVYLEKLCSYFPKEADKPQKYNNYNPKEFNLEEWLDKYGIRYTKTSYSDGTKYILDVCPFDSNHKGKDACIFQGRNGAIGFHCFHNSCSGNTWRELRLLYEPDAYEKKLYEQERKMYQNFNRDKQPVVEIVQKDGVPVFMTAEDILNKPKVEESFIKTGVEIIDRKLRGLKKGYVSVVSGLRGSAKSTWLTDLSCVAIDCGNNVGVYSGELTDKNYMKWMNLQLAGKTNVQPTSYEGYYKVPYDIQKKIATWLRGKFYLYNNDYGNNFESIIKEFEKMIQQCKLDLLILDNLMSFNVSTMSVDKYEAQKMFIWKLQEIAKKYDVHIMFVAHPRKAMGFLRLDDISGSADLSNAVDNAFIVHRNNDDFKRLTKAMFMWKDDNTIYQSTNVIEIAKDRDGGIQDEFIPLWYEKESKRLKNYPAENRIYHWDNDGFIPATDYEQSMFQ